MRLVSAASLGGRGRTLRGHEPRRGLTSTLEEDSKEEKKGKAIEIAAKRHSRIKAFKKLKK